MICVLIGRSKIYDCFVSKQKTTYLTWVCLHDHYHFHKLDGMGSHSIIVGIKSVDDDLFDADNSVPDSLHLIRDSLRFAQPVQGHFVKMGHGLKLC